MNNNFSTKIKLLIKSEKALLNLELRKKSKQAIWIAIAILSSFTALVMFNITIFLYLSESFANTTSAAILTIINLVFTAIALFISSSKNKSAEIRSIEEMRDYAWSEIANDVDETRQSFQDLKDNIFGLKSLLPVLTTLINLAKKDNKGENDAS